MSPTIQGEFHFNHTGEVLPGVVTFNPGTKPRRRTRFTGNWLTIYEAGIDALVDRSLTRTDLRVFWAVAKRANVLSPEWELNAPEVAVRLKMDYRQVQRGVAACVREGLLTRTRRGYVAFNPAMFWVGSNEARADALADTNENEDG